MTNPLTTNTRPSREDYPLTMAGDYGFSVALCTWQGDQLDRLTAERDRLREALAPFVALLQPHNDQGPDRQPIFGINDATITLGMLRTARAALGDRT